MTYFHTDEGWLYLAAVMDVYSRKITDWEMGPRMTKNLVMEAGKMAARGTKVPPGALFHSDRGSQYASESYLRILDVFRPNQRMSRRASCYDNAMMKSFFASLKKELVHHERFATRRQAETAFFDWIEGFYNRERIHSGLGYLTPAQIKAEYA